MAGGEGSGAKLKIVRNTFSCQGAAPLMRGLSEPPFLPGGEADSKRKGLSLQEGQSTQEAEHDGARVVGISRMQLHLFGWRAGVLPYDSPHRHLLAQPEETFLA